MCRPPQEDDEELPPGEERKAADAENPEEDGPPGTQAQPFLAFLYIPDRNYMSDTQLILL